MLAGTGLGGDGLEIDAAVLVVGIELERRTGQKSDGQHGKGDLKASTINFMPAKRTWVNIAEDADERRLAKGRLHEPREAYFFP